MTLKEQNDRLTKEVDRLTQENASLAADVGKLTAALTGVQRDRDQQAKDLADARAHLAAAEERDAGTGRRPARPPINRAG